MQARNACLLLACTALLCACETVSVPPRQFVEELNARQLPDAHFGESLVLLDVSPVRTVGVLSRDGRAHLWAIDEGKTLLHIDADEGGTVSREIAGTVEGDPEEIAFDAIESRSGELRVLAGSRQFVRARGSTQWTEIKGNRCIRFLNVAERLYCGFVMSGEELGAPRRTDWHAGIFILVPYAIPVLRQAKKLVIAEYAGDSWELRVVVDANDPLDAETKFLIGADNSGNVHVVYAVGRGGSVVFFAGGATGFIPESRLRYAHVGSELLLSSPTNPADGLAKRLASVSGRDVTWAKEPAAYGWEEVLETFAIDPATGASEGLIRWAARNKVRFHGKDIRVDGLFSARVGTDARAEATELVLLDDWPAEGINYRTFASPNFSAPVVAFDSANGLHALVANSSDPAVPKWSRRASAVSYLVRRDGQWSKPILLKVPLAWPSARRLLLADVERQLGVWVEEGAGLRGRWILHGSAPTEPAR